MKRSIFSFYSVLVSLLLFHLTVFAQDMRFSLHGGVALPQGDFSSTTSGLTAGYAKTGFVGMLESTKKLNGSVNLVSSVSMAFNSMDASALESQVSPFTVTSGNYVTTWAMTGIGFEIPTSPGTNIYAIGQLGVLFSSFPDITLSYGSSSVTQTAALATAFAYGFGAGININSLDIGLRYYTGEPEYEQKASAGGITNTAKVKLPASVLQLTIGFFL